MKHKHCEAIKAWADGKEVQGRWSNEEWIDLPEGDVSWRRDEYRIKPRIVQYRVAIIMGATGMYAMAVNDKVSGISIESKTNFVKWAGDWQGLSV